MKRLFAFFMAMAIIVVCSIVNAQTISGKVIGESGVAAANVTVQFKDKSNSITTNKDGSFKIVAKKLPDTLVFSAVGYEPYKVIVTEKTVKDPNFEIVLLNKREELSEVVVTGYSSVKRKEMTASTSIVTAKDISYTSDKSSALAGRVSGVEVKSSAPRSSSIRIRGSGTYKSTKDGAVVYDDIPIPSSLTAASKKIHFADSLKNVEKGFATKLLTAGEVNDFTKWKLWSDYNENEFKTFADTWRFYTKQRFTVQLQNKNKYAVVGQKVYLVNAITKDTAWAAITDNTGKAELWGDSHAANNKTENYFIVANGYENVRKPSTFENDINRMYSNFDCTVNNTVDIAFVVDATGSMGDEIEYMKLELEDVINQTFAKYNNLDLRAASVFYRDNGDEYLTKHVDFNNDLLKTLNFIKLQRAGGGGDMPEAVNSALSTALDSLHWSSNARAKLMFLILDAPPHGETREDIYQLTKRAAAQGIRIIPIVCSGADKNTEFIMRSIALATNGTYLFLTNDSGVGGDHIKPTTDAFNVELLNNLLPRIIQQMVFVNNCNSAEQQEPPMRIMPNVQQIKASPNPTTGRVNITSTKPVKDIFVADFTGKILMRIASKDKTLSWNIDISHYPAGTYIIKYITEYNEVGAEKILLIH